MRKPSSSDHFFCPATLVWPGDPEPLEWRRDHPDSIRVPVTVRNGTDASRPTPVPATPGHDALPTPRLPQAPSLAEFKSLRSLSSPHASGEQAETDGRMTDGKTTGRHASGKEDDNEATF